MNYFRVLFDMVNLPRFFVAQVQFIVIFRYYLLFTSNTVSYL